MLTMMGVGGCAVLMRRNFKAGEFLDLASRERITYTLVVPTIYTLCAMRPDFATFDLSAWRVGSFGGAPMLVPTIEIFAKCLPQLQPLNAYGATETTSPATVLPREFFVSRRLVCPMARSALCYDLLLYASHGAAVFRLRRPARRL
jgi:long-chain acyl-CoA synthetase